MAACVIAAWCEILPFAAFVLMLTWGRIRGVALDAFVKPALAGVVMGIDLVDHIVLGDSRYCSFKEMGKL